MPTCDISLMGSFRVSIDGRDVERWPHRRAADLVKLLALAEHHRLHRDRLMEELWPELTPAAAAANLRKAVHYARAALGSDGGIGTAEGMLTLWPEGELRVDVAEFETRSAAARSSEATDDFRQAAEMWRGTLLPEDLYASWAQGPRERLAFTAIYVLKRAGQWERVLELDPVDEEAHQVLMTRALDGGDRRGAMRQFETLRERLRTDLGLGPERATVVLYERALDMEGGEPPEPHERVRALIAWGLVHMSNGAFDEAEGAGRNARALALDANLGRELGEASALLGMIANGRGQWKEMFRAEFIDSVERSPELASFVFDSHLCLAEFCLAGSTPHDEIVTYAHELAEIAESADSLQGRALAELLLGEAALFSGRLDHARTHLGSATDLHEAASAPAGQAISLQRIAEACVALRDPDAADRSLETAFEAAGRSSLTPHLLVRLHGARVEAAQDPSEAVARLARADEELAGRDLCAPCSIGFLIAASVTLARAGRLEGARSRLDEAERIAGMWSGGPWGAAVWGARAALRRAEGSEEQAVALLREAAARFADAGRTLDAERCLAAAVPR
ncbi:MAG TPA: BTAD domain-containing putative transcriptional regulator [Actinomycetota bacterium]|nr:BTAD domain-containing putative transcriptional regulator [Actinomycetota bacterium]